MKITKCIICFLLLLLSSCSSITKNKFYSNKISEINSTEFTIDKIVIEPSSLLNKNLNLNEILQTCAKNNNIQLRENSQNGNLEENTISFLIVQDCIIQGLDEMYSVSVSCSINCNSSIYKCLYTLKRKDSIESIYDFCLVMNDFFKFIKKDISK